MKDLDKFKNEMNLSGQNVYVGHRYVPKILGEWDNTNIYEPLSIVQYQGASYTSRQYVPVGVEITNEEYWAVTGNYNAQVEQYRQEVQKFDGRIYDTEMDILDHASQLNKKVTNVKSLIGLLNIQNPKNNDTVKVEQYYEDDSENEGGGYFVWQEELNKNLHDGGMYIDPNHTAAIGDSNWYDSQNVTNGVWVRINESPVNLLWFGAKRDKSMDSSKPLQNAINFSARHTILNTAESDEILTESLYIPSGNYLLENTVLIEKSGHVIYGDGESTKLYADSTKIGEDNPMIDATLARQGYLNIEKLMFVGSKNGNTDIRQLEYIPKVVGLRLGRVSHSTKGMTSKFHSLSFYGCKVGVIFALGWLVEFAYCSFVGSMVSNRVGVGIYLGQQHNALESNTYNAVTIRRCNFQYLNWGILAKYGRNLSIDDCSFELIRRGVFFSNVRGGRLTNSYFEALEEYGVLIGETSNAATRNPEKDAYNTSNIIVENNTIQGPSIFAQIRGCYRIQVKNNIQQGIEYAQSKDDLIGTTIALPTQTDDGNWRIIDSYIEYFNNYRIGDITKKYSPNTLFVDVFEGQKGSNNSTINALLNTIVETGNGSNGSNGSYIKFADGTLICKGDMLEVPINTPATFTYPHRFSVAVAPIITPTINSRNTVFSSNSHLSTPSVRAYGEDTMAQFSYIAIGRWK